MSLLAYITWDVSPIIAQIGPLTLRWYGLLFMSGFVVGTFVLSHIYKSEGVRPSWVDVITIYMLVGTIVGARLGHCLFYDPKYYLANPLDILKIWEGGLASHGATIGILLACWLFARNNKFDYLWVLDRIVIVVAIGGALIRLGNLMNSEIVGQPTDKPWAFVFPRDTEHLQPARPGETLPAGALYVERKMQADGKVGIETHPASYTPTATTEVAVPRHPTQLYESVFCILLLTLLYALWNRTKDRTPRGLLFGLFVVILFTQRFLGEFLKEDQGGWDRTMMDATHLNLGQLLSIPLILVGIWVLWRAGKDPHNPYGYAPRDLGQEEETKPVARAR
ncbi:prolipoprotein diacylglyceryl transferase [Hymenobacter cellulosivorans]|uniref:Phosphatidylglycerol--prolipoprotein diacylglyceryl transferase n=1 Tax=Hymenobacter cellulosivorans TaxID=2932249 RepID=A0ABY4FET1_9BACT|nr:prolipoprotein diacylglyceryl transferase [Hymenobacter cellulosivorans]UOQ55114.1 prolipoprotein diacylglyceryl transferase [Hymenobacter cellulosivorans]